MLLGRIASEEVWHRPDDREIAATGQARETYVINHSIFTRSLRDSTALRALTLLGAGVAATSLFVAPASAQTAPTPAPSSSDDQNVDTRDDIVVTGSLIARRVDSETPSPVTTLTSDTLDKRGINTAADAVQLLSANGAGTIGQGWNTGSNFATGANAPSLRGLTVQSTLTIFDGLRMAPYPLADDGHRNFVDLNTIPDAIIDRVEVLRDGASSTYGADAVAGVINIITKKEIKGLYLNGSAGISQKGDAGEQRLDATFGYGDLKEQGFNFYVNAEYQKNDPLWARDRGYPYNTSDLSGICNDAGVCMRDLRQFGISKNGKLTTGSTIVPLYREYNTAPVTLVDPLGVSHTFAAGTIATGPYTLAPGAGGCGNLNSVTLTSAQQQQVTPWSPIKDDNGVITGYNSTGVSYSGGTYAPTQCQQDLRSDYSQLLPAQERLGFATRFTANIGSRAQLYAMGNYYQVRTKTLLSPLGFAGQTTPPGSVLYSPVLLPVYVCATGSFTPGASPFDNGCNAGNGVLNPNNPYAAQGQLARLLGRYDQPRRIESKSRALRAAIGIDGSFGDNWNYSANFTASNTQLDIIQSNYLIPSRLMDVIANGTYNFINPSANSQAVRDYIAPVNRTRSTSDLWQAQATLAKDLFTLPGGPLQAAVGVSYRHESIDNPSANPQNDAHPYDRYYGVNSVGAAGSRNVKSAFFEINAPLLDMLEINGSGRYDSYSSGQSNFSPKIGAKFSPIKEFALRGTWSKGFRIPSFNEAYGLPTTGYITFQLDPSIPAQAAFIAAHGGNSYATNQYSVGLTATGNPTLKPEKSTSWTLGAIFEPIKRVSFTVDYWNIKVKDLIGGVDYSGIPDLYYANNGAVNIPGVTVRPQLADPANPQALALLGFIEYSFQNADEQQVSGIDFGMNAQFNLGSNIKLTSVFDASYLIKFEKRFDSGAVQRYDGTLSPCDVTSCSGAPKWRANWQNTIEVGPASFTLTAYYTGGYDLASIDYGGVKGDCAGSVGASVVTYTDGTPVLCSASPTWNADFSASYEISKKFTIYANVLNVFGLKAPFDPSGGYSIGQYNPAWASSNVLGRYFRVGAKVHF
jgi:iron complex outermembrane receptor protein